MKIFISYRQEDTGGYARQLCEMLQTSFGQDAVFFDIKSIELGANWLQVVEERIRACDVLLLPIGSQWLTITDKKGRTRLTNPKDPLRLEIGAAIRAKLRIIPLLIAGAHMPEEEQLPQDLSALAHCVALDLRHASFERDVADLIERLGGDDVPSPRVTGPRPAQPPPVGPTQFPQVPPASFVPQFNLTGTWQGLTGIVYALWQQGSGLVAESRNMFGVVVFHGQGTLTGNQIAMVYDASYQPPFVVRGQMSGVVSPDGMIITGQAMDQVTGMQPIQLRRIA